MEGLGVRGKASAALHLLIVDSLQRANVTVVPRPWMRGWLPDRLGGWLSRHYGPITLAYELNSQAADRHLNLQQQKAIGAIFADMIPEFFSSPNGLAILSDVDTRRQERSARWAKHGPVPEATNAIEAEDELSKDVGIVSPNASDDQELLVEKRVR